MARLDEIAQFLGCWQGVVAPTVDSPTALIFAADHGVVVEGVSAYPSEVTGAMMSAFTASKASVSALARVAGATVTAIDVGVGDPTGNLRVEPALSHERLSASFERGRAEVRSLDTDLLIVGEMGIGNSTAASTLSAALLARNASELVGRGTGVGAESLRRKQEVIEDALVRIGDETDPIELLRQVGGAEIAAMAGALFEARIRSIPTLLDGFIATTPALTLHSVNSDMTTHCLAAHRSAEPGHSLLLDRLRLDPLLELDMRLGEASGAMAALPLLKMACALVNEVPTFTEWFG